MPEQCASLAASSVADVVMLYANESQAKSWPPLPYITAFHRISDEIAKHAEIIQSGLRSDHHVCQIVHAVPARIAMLARITQSHKQWAKK